MDKQTKNIKLLENGDIRLKTGRVVTPCNKVYTLDLNTVELRASNKFVVAINTEDYFNYALWANCLEMGHADIRKGVVGIDTGYTHKSVAALIMHTDKDQKVGYKDGNKFNLRKSNLYIKGETATNS
jgi:hypothetical protein